MGVVECAKHELLQPFNVLYEKEGECRGWEPAVDNCRWVPESGESVADSAAVEIPEMHFEGPGIYPPGNSLPVWLLDFVLESFQ